MAIDKTKLVIDIETKFGNTNQNFLQLENHLENVSVAASKTEKSYVSLNKNSELVTEKTTAASNAFAKQTLYLKEMNKLAANENLLKIVDTQTRLANIQQNSTKQIIAYGDANAQANNQINNLSKGLKDQIPVVKVLSSIWDRLETTVSIIDDFLSIVDRLTEPEQLKKLSNLLKIFAAIMRFKGFKDLSNNLFTASDAVGDFATKVEEWEDKNSKAVENLANKIETVRKVFRGLDYAMNGALTAAAGFSAIGLIKTFKEINPVILRTILQSGSLREALKNLRAEMPYFKSVFLDSFKNVAKSGQDFFKSGRSLLQVVKHSSSGLLGMAEAGKLLGPVLFALGTAMVNAEGKLNKFLGALTIGSAIILVGFAAAIGFLTRSIGTLLEAIGDRAINAMTEFTKISQKASYTLKQFEFVIIGFGRTLGTNFVGDLDYWNKQLELMTENTIFSVDAIRKSIKLLIAEGSGLGLTAEQNSQILKAAADIASSTGQELEDVVTRINAALLGQTMGLANLGIRLDETSLSHSRYLKTLGKGVDELDQQEMLLLRLNELHRQSIPMMGAAKAATDTIIGANIKYEQSLKNLQAALGSQGTLTVTYVNMLTKLLTLLTQLPPIVTDFVGSLWDIFAITAKILGIFLQYILTIGLLQTAYSFLSVAIATNTTAQVILTFVMERAALAVGSQAIAVTSLATLWKSLTSILLAGSGIILTKLLVALKAIPSAISKIIFNLKFLKIAALITVIFAAIETIRDLYNEFEWFSLSISETGKKLSLFDKILKGIQATFNAVWGTIKNFIKLAVIGLGEGLIVAAMSVLKLKRAISNFVGDAKKVKELDKDIGILNVNLYRLNQIAGKTLTDTILLFEATAEAANLAGQNINDLHDSMSKLSESKKLLEKINNQINRSALETSVFGNEFEKAKLRIEEANISVQNLTKEFLKSQDKQKEIGEKLLDATKEQIIAEFELKKLRLDSIRNISDQMEQMQIQILNNSDQYLKATELENKAKLQTFDNEIIKLKDTYKLRNDELEIIDKARESLIKLNTMALDDARIRQYEKELGNVSQRYEDLIKKTNELEIANQSFGKTALDIARSQTEEQLKQIDILEEQLKLTGKLAGKETELSRARTAIKEAGVLEEQKIKLDISGEIGNVGGQLASTFGNLGSLMGGEMGNILSSISSEIMASVASTAAGIFAIILKAPEIINMVSGLINQITNWHKALKEAMKGFWDSLVNFITDFIPNFIQSFGDILMDTAIAFAERIPDAITSLIDRVPDFLERLIERLPEIAVKFGEALVKMDISVLIAKLTIGIIKATPRIIIGFVKAIPKIIEAFVKGIFNGLSGLGDYIFGEDLSDKVNNSFKKLATTITGQTSQIFKIADLEAFRKRKEQASQLGADMNKFALNFLDLLRKWLGELDKLWKQLWNWAIDLLQKTWSWIYDNILKPITDGLKEVWMFIWDKIIQPLISGLDSIFQFVGQNIVLPLINGLKSIWDFVEKNIIKPLIEGLSSIWNFVNDKIVTPLIDGLKSVWNFVNDKIVAPLTSGIQKLLDNIIGLGESFLNFGKQIVKGFEDGIAALGNFFVNIGEAIWKGLQSGINNAGDFFVNIGNSIWLGLKKGFDTIGNLFTKIFDTTGAWGKGKIENTLSTIAGASVDVPFMKFAKGGLVPGMPTTKGDSELNDRILALLSPGEAIVPRSIMQDPFWSAIIKSLIDKNIQIPKFGLGGAISKVTGGKVNIGGTAGKILDGDISGAVSDVGKVSIKTLQSDLNNAWKAIESVIDTLDPTAMWRQVQERVLKGLFWDMIESNKFQNGGLVTGLGGTVEPGEFVINRPAVREIGLSNLNDLNGMKFGSNQAKINQEFKFEIKIETKKDIDRDFIKNTLFPEIEKQLRRKSIDGRRLIEATGIGL